MAPMKPLWKWRYSLPESPRIKLVYESSGI